MKTKSMTRRARQVCGLCSNRMPFVVLMAKHIQWLMMEMMSMTPPTRQVCGLVYQTEQLRPLFAFCGHLCCSCTTLHVPPPTIVPRRPLPAPVSINSAGFAVGGENAEPNAYSDSESEDDSVVVVEPEPKPRQAKAAAAPGAGQPVAPPPQQAVAASALLGGLTVAQLQAMHALSQQSKGQLQPAQVANLASQLTPEQLQQMLAVGTALWQPQQAQQAQQAQQQQQQQQGQQQQQEQLQVQQLRALVQQLHVQREQEVAQQAAREQQQRAQEWLQQQLAREAQLAKQQQQQQQKPKKG